MTFAVIWASLWLLPASPKRIVERNIFCSGCRGSPPGEKLALPLELVAILRAPDPRESQAAIWSPAEHQAALYAVGARIGEAQVTAIGARRVWLRVGSRTAELSLDDHPPVPIPIATSAPSEIRCSGARCEIDRALVNRLIADPSQLAGWVRAMPSPKGGVTLLWVRPGSPLAQLGLESGDRLHALNGTPLGDLPQMLDAYMKLKTATRVSIALDRKGALKTLDYQIR